MRRASGHTLVQVGLSAATGPGTAASRRSEAATANPRAAQRLVPMAAVICAPKSCVCTQPRPDNQELEGSCAAVAVGCCRIMTSRFLPRSGHPGTSCVTSPTAVFRGAADIGDVLLRDGILKVCCRRLRTGTFGRLRPSHQNGNVRM